MMKVLPSKDQILPILIVALVAVAVASRVPFVGKLVYPASK